METQHQRSEPAQPKPKPHRGAPSTCAAQAVRRDVSVRVSVTASFPEPEELREPGYGHGV
jgi:hypothetical protein